MDPSRFFPGALVAVRCFEEILRTLDGEGALDGLVFMPEMLAYCGRSFRVARQARKTCVERFGQFRFIDMREFRHDDVWILQGLRCGGAEHGGCGRACTLFWKAAWLRNVESDSATRPANAADRERMLERLKTRADSGRYICQSTQLEMATQQLPWLRRVKKSFDDWRSGTSGLFEILYLLMVPLWRKGLYHFIKRHWMGPLKQTPLERLDLQAGELVEVKSRREIKSTLNIHGCNRGLRFDRAMGRFCGRRFRVRSRLDCMISESSGRMLKVEGTVILDGLTCLCHTAAIGGCPRQEPIFWREIWLKRIGNG